MGVKKPEIFAYVLYGCSLTAYELDLLGQVILFFANELDLFIKIKEMVILNNLDKGQ